MAKPAFIRLAEVINKHEEKRVVSVTVKPTVIDCSGTIWLTDLQLQEGSALNGYAPNTETFLKEYREDGKIKPPVWFNGVVRTEATVIICNLGETSAGLDVRICPKSDMAAGSISMSQSAGGQRVSFPQAIEKDSELALLASMRQCTKNGQTEPHEGFYQYSAAWDTKHNITLEEGKSAYVLLEIQEMQDGAKPF